jgi:membrane fusion protein
MLPRPLFRQQAIEFQQHHLQWGDVSALQPLSTKMMSWFLIAVTAGLIAFITIAQYARKETVIGYLTPTKGTAKIFAERRGVIREVHVREGETVPAGKPLLTIKIDQIAADGSDLNAELLATLTAQKAALDQNITAEELRTDSERERLESLVRGLESEISQLRSQLTLQADRLNLAESDLAAGEQLVKKGFSTAVELRKRQLSVLELRQERSNFEQQISAKQNQLTETRSALNQLPTMMAQKVQSLRNELSVAEQRISEINARNAYVIRSPVTGRVTTLQAREGQSADPQRLQLEIIPTDSVLQAELFVPSRAIGFVEPGQSVRILYDAFPYQHFGTYRGEVVEVSQSILTSADAGGPIKLNEPAYRVIAALERPDVDAYGRKLALQPDMLLRADIVLERRSLLSWLTRPLQSVRM